MRPFFSYYGGKWRAARLYPEPEHELVIEPFAGSACYSTFWNVKRALLLDTAPLVADCWRYLLATTPERVMALPDGDPDRPIAEWGGDPEARPLIGTWCNQGTASQRFRMSAWQRKASMGAKGRCAEKWWSNVRTRIASQLRGISEWEFRPDDYRSAPDIEATWFIDPPYRGPPGSHYPHGSGGLDFEELGEWCRSRRGLVIVCEGPGHGDWLPFRPMANVPARSMPGAFRTSAEYVWVNRTTPPAQQVLPFGVPA